ncbi:hypothetical protein J6590_105962 [Homalodisca vitripennis]|nr:hypothetical protein J6590_105962 [Homalodisca vitripennis]
MSYTRTTIVAVHYLAERLDMIVHIPNKSETAETEEPEANSGESIQAGGEDMRDVGSLGCRDVGWRGWGSDFLARCWFTPPLP